MIQILEYLYYICNALNNNFRQLWKYGQNQGQNNIYHKSEIGYTKQGLDFEMD